MSNTVRFVLVRLCECEGNESNKIHSHGKLIPKGIQQAQATRERLKGLAIKTWVSADNSACHETAELLADGGPIITMAEFNEAYFPKWQGKTKGEAKEEYPNEWKAYAEPTPGFAYFRLFPDAESLAETCQRAMGGLLKLYKKHEHDKKDKNGKIPIGIVTHGDIVRLLPMALLQTPLENLFFLNGQNGAVTIFDFDGVKATFDCVNDYSHLPESKDFFD